MTGFLRAALLAVVTLASPSVSAEEAPAATVVVAPAVNPAFLVPTRAAPPLIRVPDAVLRSTGPLLSPRPAAFASLEDAVAAHHGAAAGGDAERCLAGAVFFESKGEPLFGQLAVAQVVVNRARSGRFADDVCGVVRQPGQFSFVRNGVIPAVDEARAAWRTAVAVAKVSLAEAWGAAAPRALYFRARAAGVRGGMVRVAAIGNHVFFR